MSEESGYLAGLPADKLVRLYREIRDAKNELEQQMKEQVGELRAQLDMIESRMLEICNEHNTNSISTPSGTIMRKTSTRYWTSDWEKMYEFIDEHNAYNLLEQRISNGNMREFLEEHPDLLPIGLNSDTRQVITVRKPYRKED